MKIAAADKDLIRAFLVQKIARAKKITHIDDHDNLIESGIIDSLGIMHLVAYLEGTFNVKVRDEDIVPDNFESLEVLSSYIDTLR